MESSEGKLCLITTSPSSPEPSRDAEIVEEWLLRFATNASQQLSDGLVALWKEEFATVEPRVLERAFRATMRGHTFNSIPPVGQIWAQVREIREAVALEEQEAAHEQRLSNQPSWDELYRRGTEYRERMPALCAEILPGRKNRVGRESSGESLVIASPERLAELEAQKRKILPQYAPISGKS